MFHFLKRVTSNFSHQSQKAILIANSNGLILIPYGCVTITVYELSPCVTSFDSIPNLRFIFYFIQKRKLSKEVCQS